MWNDKKIPENEHENILHLYWMMLQEMESVAMSKNDACLKHTVSAAYTVLNRCGISDLRPRWETTPENIRPGALEIGPKESVTVTDFNLVMVSAVSNGGEPIKDGKPITPAPGMAVEAECDPALRAGGFTGIRSEPYRETYLPAEPMPLSQAIERFLIPSGLFTMTMGQPDLGVFVWEAEFNEAVVEKLWCKLEIIYSELNDRITGRLELDTKPVGTFSTPLFTIDGLLPANIKDLVHWITVSLGNLRTDAASGNVKGSTNKKLLERIAMAADMVNLEIKRKF